MVLVTIQLTVVLCTCKCCLPPFVLPRKGMEMMTDACGGGKEEGGGGGGERGARDDYGLLCDQWGRMGWLSLLLPRLILQHAPPSTHTQDNCTNRSVHRNDTILFCNNSICNKIITGLHSHILHRVTIQMSLLQQRLRCTCHAGRLGDRI